MWYEIFPSAIIIYACLSGPQYIMPRIAEYFTGLKVTRSMVDPYSREMFHRDSRLNDGKVWKRVRLEAVPDEPEIK